MSTFQTISLPNNLHVQGVLSSKTYTPVAGSITDAAIVAAAGIAASKQEHRFSKGYAQESATACADEIRVVHAVHGATGLIVAFEAGLVVPPDTTDTVAIDLLVNGASVLTAPIALTSATAARTPVVGAIATAALAVGDVVEIKFDVTVVAGTHALGVFANVLLNEDAV